MDIDTLLVILLVWTVAGFFAAMAFGMAVRGTDAAKDMSTDLPNGRLDIDVNSVPGVSKKRLKAGGVR